jgi:hypothetical protein
LGSPGGKLVAMLATYYQISSHDSRQSPFVLRVIDSDGKCVVRPAYRDLVCQKCKKVDEKAALARGISGDVRVKSDRPFLLSMDDFYLVDERARAVLSSLLSGVIEFHPIPAAGYCVASATRWLVPEPSNPGLRFAGGRCRECGRAREVVWGPAAPRADRVEPLLCFDLEGIRGAREAWLVSADVAARLKKVSPPLTGMVVTPKEVEIQHEAGGS